MAKRERRQIVKVQRPIMSNAGDMVLIYNHDRTIMTQIPMWEDLRNLMDKDLKAFFEYTLDRKSDSQCDLVIGRKLAHSEWPNW